MFWSVPKKTTDSQPSKTAPRARLPKPVRNVLLSAGALLVLFVIAAVGYTFYMDSNGRSMTTKPVDTTEAYQPVKPVKPAPDAKEGAAVELLTSPVSAGSNASISVQTNPTSTCTISVVYGTAPHAIASTDSGLTSKVADAYGTVSWSWTVEPNAPVGTWPVKVTCTYNKQTAVVQGDLAVQAQSTSQAN